MNDLPSVATPEETARFLRIGRSTLAKMRLSGKGPVYVKAGRSVTYRRDDVLTWLGEQTRRSTSDVGGL